MHTSFHFNRGGSLSASTTRNDHSDASADGGNRWGVHLGWRNGFHYPSAGLDGAQGMQTDRRSLASDLLYVDRPRYRDGSGDPPQGGVLA